MSGMMERKNHGVAKVTTNMLTKAAKTQLIIERTVKGRTRSTQPISPETRFNMRPRGVESKKSIGACVTAMYREAKSRRDAWTPPMAIAYPHNISTKPTNVNCQYWRATTRPRQLSPLHTTTKLEWRVAAWLNGSALVSINEVTLRRAC